MNNQLCKRGRKLENSYFLTSKLLQAAVIKSLGLRSITQWQKFNMCEALRTIKPRKFGIATKDTQQKQRSQK